MTGFEIFIGIGLLFLVAGALRGNVKIARGDFEDE